MPTSVLQQPKNPPLGTFSCFHCHDACPDDRLRIEDKHFCCEGCKMVYEILNTHNLCEFYALDADSASAIRRPSASHKNYAYLDDQEVQEKLIEFQQGQTAQLTFYLPNMHCVSCIWLLENLYKLDAGVSHSRVNFLKKTATIQYNTQQTSLRKIATLLSSIGYEPDINLGDVEGKKPPVINRRLAYQLGIAGFAFGNVMLFSFPEYVGMSRDMDPWFSNVFGYLSILIALPVLLFSAKDYFVSAWQGLKSRQLNIDIPLCLALGSLFFRSIWEILTHTGAGYLDSFSGLTFLLLIGKWFQQRVWHELSFERDYKSYFPVAATVRKGEEESTVPVSRLVPGDIILVRSHEIIPADGILLKGNARVDYSFVTGESDPVMVQSGEKIFAGGKQLGEGVEISLTRRVAQSHLTQLWNNEAFKTNAKGQVTQLADAAGKWFTLLILAFGGTAFLYWWGLRDDMATAINAFTAVMIVACPCNIALSIPFTLGNIMRLLGRQGLYLKNIRVVESFSDISAVVLDKTGTITNTTGAGLKWLGELPDGKDLSHAHVLSLSEKIAIRSLVRHSSHPLSRQVYQALPELPTLQPDFFEEVPGLGIQGMINGAEVRVGSYAHVMQDAGLAKERSSSGGVYVSVDGKILGHFEVKTRFRNGLDDVLAFFNTLFKEKPRHKSSSLFLLSGDQDKEASILAPYFPVADTMRFHQTPQDKLDFIKKMQQEGQKVMMLGDGLNDAGALRQSDLGIVVAENANNFTPACDAILHADHFHRLPQFIQFAQEGVKIVHWSYLVSLTYNAIGLSFAVTGSLSPLVAAILMPASSISIVLFGVGMSNWANRRLMRA